MYGRLRSAWIRCASRIGISESEKLALWRSASAVSGGRPCLATNPPLALLKETVQPASRAIARRKEEEEEGSRRSLYFTRSARLRGCRCCLARRGISSSWRCAVALAGLRPPAWNRVVAVDDRGLDAAAVQDLESLNNLEARPILTLPFRLHEERVQFRATQTKRETRVMLPKLLGGFGASAQKEGVRTCDGSGQ